MTSKLEKSMCMVAQFRSIVDVIFPYGNFKLFSRHFFIRISHFYDSRVFLFATGSIQTIIATGGMLDQSIYVHLVICMFFLRFKWLLLQTCHSTPWLMAFQCSQDSYIGRNFGFTRVWYKWRVVLLVGYYHVSVVDSINIHNILQVVLSIKTL